MQYAGAKRPVDDVTHRSGLEPGAVPHRRRPLNHPSERWDNRSICGCSHIRQARTSAKSTIAITPERLPANAQKTI
jgi:hypothetical protein